MIIDQLPALAYPQETDEIPIERGQLTYKIPWSNLAGGDIAALKSDMTAAQAAIDDLETDMTAAQAALSNVVLEATEQTITSSTTGTSAWIALTGLTADHVVGNWGLRNSDGAIPVNSPPCDIEIETAAGQWRYTLTNNSTAFYLKPTFILKQN